MTLTHDTRPLGMRQALILGQIVEACLKEKTVSWSDEFDNVNTGVMRGIVSDPDTFHDVTPDDDIRNCWVHISTAVERTIPVWDVMTKLRESTMHIR